MPAALNCCCGAGARGVRTALLRAASAAMSGPRDPRDGSGARPVLLKDFLVPFSLSLRGGVAAAPEVGAGAAAGAGGAGGMAAWCIPGSAVGALPTACFGLMMPLPCGLVTPEGPLSLNFLGLEGAAAAGADGAGAAASGATAFAGRLNLSILRVGAGCGRVVCEVDCDAFDTVGSRGAGKCASGKLPDAEGWPELVPKPVL